MKLVEKLDIVLLISKLNSINEKEASDKLTQAFKDLDKKQKASTTKNLENLLRTAIEDLRRVRKSKNSKLDRKDMQLVNDVTNIIYRIMKSMNMRLPTDKFSTAT